MLLLFQFHFSGSANFDHTYATSQLGQALLELLAVIVAGRLFNQGADLAHTSLDLLLFASPLDDSRVVFGNYNCAGPSQVTETGILKFEAGLLGDDFTTGENSDIFQYGITAVAKARSLHGHDIKGTAQFVDDQCRQGLTVYILGDNQHVFIA